MKVKNHRIEARVSEHTKVALKRKAEMYGSLTKFFEEIAEKDIIVMDRNTKILLEKLYGKNAVSSL